MRGGWTNEQLDAINGKGENLLVSAAAGSGKTAVLIERIIRLITDNGREQADIDRLLVVTFTKAAAAEMKGRLRQRLTEMLREDKDNAALQKQLALLPRASVSTFDSLCQRIVRESFVALDVDPSFKVGDEEELHLLRMQALDDVFEAHYQDAGFRELVETFCESADDFELREVVLSVFNFIQTERLPDKWLCDKARAYSAARLSDTVYAGFAFEFARSELNAALSALKRAHEAASLPGGPAGYIARLGAEIDMLKRALGAEDYLRLAEEIRNIYFDKLPGVKKSENVDEGLKGYAQEHRNAAKKMVAGVIGNYFTKDADGLLADINGAYPALKTLSDIVGFFSERYMELKKERKILSFSDIKLLCYKALVADGGYTDTALAYRKQFAYVLVDEYQDTNDVEEGILDALSGNSEGIGNRFMVGDVKQSIYRFRQSKPELFIEKSEAYKARGGGRLVTLHRNFRSREYILNGINFIFSQIMSRDAAEIEYDRSAALVGSGEAEGRDKPEAIEITLIETDTAEPEEAGEGAEAGASEAINELKSLEVEAAHIADKIAELINGGTRPGDIVILMRSGKRNGALVSDMLSRKGIPSHTDEREGYFELTEISDMLSLLSVIDNPLQEIPLVATLASPLFGFSADELIELRTGGNGSFYSAIERYAADNAGELAEKAASFLSKLSGYRKTASRAPVSELLSELYDDTEYYIIAGAMSNGAIRQENLRKLLKRAADFEKSTFPGLFHFVRYMERLKERNMPGQASRAADEGSAVRILTIHKSKGLEFPVVFLAGCGSRFNLRDLSDKLIFHQELGYGAVYVDWRKRTKTDTLPRAVVREKLRREALAEEMRLLYVAATRAKERLYISGSAGKDANAAIGKWLGVSSAEGGVFSPEAVLGVRTYLDWIMPAALRSPSLSEFLTKSGFPAPITENDYAAQSSFSLSIAKRSETDAGVAESGPQTVSAENFSRKIAEIAENTTHQIDIDKLLNWKYNYSADVDLPVKLSVSEIKTQYQRLIAGEAETGLAEFFPADEEILLPKPSFMQERKGLSPSERGTAIHSVLARLDPNAARGSADIIALMDELLEKRILSQQEYDAVNIAEIEDFLNSPIAERIRRAEKVRREVPFVIGINPEDAYLPPSGEIVLVHGIIDCFFEQNGGIVVIDYKTDYVADEDFEKLRRKYKIQLEIYRSAVGRITQKPVTETYLYMLRYRRLIEV